MGKALITLTPTKRVTIGPWPSPQLAGIKLFLLAALWTVPLGLLTGVIFGENNVSSNVGHSLGIVPRLGDLFANPAACLPRSRFRGWRSISS